MSEPSTMSVPPASARAEAAAWVARLQGPERNEATERAFRRWVEADPAHAAAFDRATQVWEGIGGAAAGMKVGAGRRARGRAMARVAASIAAVSMLAGGGWMMLRDPVYATEVGEQRTVRLEDGSLLALNTDTKVVVHYAKGRRELKLIRGEAQFDVAKDASRPFVVTAEGQQVRALGTSFVVRDEGKTIAVTLLEGTVTVASAKAATKVVNLTPGQRVTVGADAPPRLDRPSIKAVTAWRSGQILLDDTPLSQAIAEMNRYSDRPLAIEGKAGDVRVTGIFRAGESQAFARTVAAQFGLAVVEQSDQTLLAPPPQG